MAVLARDDVADLVHLDEGAEALVLGYAAHGHEKAADRDLTQGAVELVPDLHGGQTLVGDQTVDRGIVDELHVLPRGQTLHGGILAAKGIPAVDQIDLVGKVGQIEGVLQGGVAAAHDGDVLLAEEVAVAGRAVGDASPDQLVLPVHTELTVFRAGSKDDRAAFVGVPGGRDLLFLPEVSHAGDLLQTDLRAEADGLIVELVCKVKAGDMGLNGIVLDIGGVDDLPAPGLGLEHQNGLGSPPGVDRSGQTGRAGADDDNIVRHISRAGRGPLPSGPDRRCGRLPCRP